MSETRATVVAAGRLYDGSGGPGLPDMGVLVRGEFIVAVAPLDSLELDDDVDLLDARGATLTPGFVDAHTHPGWALDASTDRWRTASATSAGRVAWVIDAVQAALAAGVTTIRDCGSPPDTTTAAAALLSAGVVNGARLIASGPCITTTAGHAAFIGVTADDEHEAVRRVRQLCAGGAAVIKVMASGGDMDPETNRRMPQFGVNELSAIVTEAHRLGRRVVAHATCTAAIERAVTAGVDVIAHCNWLAAEADRIDYRHDVAQRIVDFGIAVDLDLPNSVADYATRDGCRETFVGWPRPPRSRWDLHESLRSRAVPIMLTSDAFGDELGALPSRLADAFPHLDLSVGTAIRHVTSVPASVVCPDRQIGTIEPGLRAEFALFAGDLEDSIDGLRRCVGVWQNGRPVALSRPRGDASA